MDTRKAVKTYHRNLAIVLAIIVAIFAAIPLVVDKPYIINIFVLTFYMSTLSMAWNILGGITGQNSLGLAAYMGLGAYVCCLVVTKTGMNPWVAAVLDMLVVGVVAGVIFTLVSIAFAESIRQFIINSEFFGRASGVGLPFGKDSFAQFRFTSKVPYYYIGFIMMVGVYLITTHGSLTGLAVSPAALVSGIVSACCVAIYTMWPKKLQEQYPTPMLQGWAFLMGGIMFSLIFRPWQIDYVPTAMGVFGIFIVVVLGNVLAFSLYMSGVPLIGPQKASLYSFAEPVTAAIISTLVLGSPFTLWDALGFGCIFLMLVLLSLPAKQKN